jgi:hypothetical protein
VIGKKLISEVMREMGRRGGKIGGKRSLETMTPEERSARAKIAATAASKKRTAERLDREAREKKPSR